MKIAWLTPAGLHLRAEDGTVRSVESAFAQSVRNRHQSIHRRNAWKTGGEGRVGSFGSGDLLWGTSARDPEQIRIAVTSIAATPDGGELLYSLDADGLDAVCSVSLTDLTEKRLMHGSERKVRFLSISDDGSRLACSVAHPDGSASIAIMKPDATDLAEVTEGESVDLAPSFVAGSRDALVYQAAGIGRDRSGFPVALSPFSVHRIDIARGEVDTVLESATHDFLGPRQAADGTIYAIRRPTAQADKPNAFRVMLDILLIPFRVAWALFQYLNFFSTRYTGKPLTTAGGPKREAADLRQMMVWGNLINAEEAARDARDHPNEPPPIVPKSWELVARRPDGALSTLAKSVVSFDLAGDGSVVWSTGSAIYRRDARGNTERLVEERGIEQVIALS
jgi:hypothetical protein